MTRFILGNIIVTILLVPELADLDQAVRHRLRALDEARLRARAPHAEIVAATEVTELRALSDVSGKHNRRP